MKQLSAGMTPIDVLMELFVANCTGPKRSASLFDQFLIMAITPKAGCEEQWVSY